LSIQVSLDGIETDESFVFLLIRVFPLGIPFAVQHESRIRIRQLAATGVAT